MIEMEKNNCTATNYTYSQYCSFRLPCGVCTRTNSFCPVSSGCTPWWGVYPPTITTQTGTMVSTKEYTATGATTAKCDMSQYEHGEWKKGD